MTCYNIILNNDYHHKRFLFFKSHSNNDQCLHKIIIEIREITKAPTKPKSQKTQ